MIRDMEHYSRDKRISIAVEAADELERACNLHGAFNSAHEGFAVLKEEVDELWDEVKKNPAKNPDRLVNMRAEAIQVAAMAMRFIYDITDDKEA